MFWVSVIICNMLSKILTAVSSLERLQITITKNEPLHTGVNHGCVRFICTLFAFIT